MSDPFEDIAREYPYPIAWASRRFGNSVEEVERFLCLGLLVEVTIRYLAAIYLAYYLREEERIDEVQNMLPGLNRPSLGHWMGLLGFLSKHYHRLDRSPLPGLTRALEQRHGRRRGPTRIFEGVLFAAELTGDARARTQRASIRDFLEILVTYRNRTSGHGVGLLTPSFCREQTEHLAAPLAETLGELSILARCPIGQVSDVHIESDRAVHTIFDWTGLARRKVDSWSASLAERVPKHRLYLWSEGRPRLGLNPFFAATEDELFVLDYVDGDDLAFVGCRTWKASRPKVARSAATVRLTQACADPHGKLGETTIAVAELDRETAAAPPESPLIDLTETIADPSGAAPPAEVTIDDQLARALAASLDDGARGVVIAAYGEALRLGHALGVEHILMAFTRAPALVKALRARGVRPAEIRSALRRHLPMPAPGWRSIDAEQEGSRRAGELLDPRPEGARARVTIAARGVFEAVSGSIPATAVDLLSAIGEERGLPEELRLAAPELRGLVAPREVSDLVPDDLRKARHKPG